MGELPSKSTGQIRLPSLTTSFPVKVNDYSTVTNSVSFCCHWWCYEREIFEVFHHVGFQLLLYTLLTCLITCRNSLKNCFLCIALRRLSSIFRWWSLMLMFRFLWCFASIPVVAVVFVWQTQLLTTVSNENKSCQQQKTVASTSRSMAVSLTNVVDFWLFLFWAIAY